MAQKPTHNCTRRDEALAAIEDAIRQQGEQERAIETEVAGYKRDIAKQQVGDGVGICLWVFVCMCRHHTSGRLSLCMAHVRMQLSTIPQIANEQLGSVARKVEGEADVVSRQVGPCALNTGFARTALP